MRPSKEGQYLSGVSDRYLLQLNTYEEVNSEVIVVKIFASRRLYNEADLRNKKLKRYSQSRCLSSVTLKLTCIHPIPQRQG